MIINGEKLQTLAVYPSMMTVPDCLVSTKNKLGHGHGEAKFYIGTKEEMYQFYGDAGFSAKCFMLKKDLIAYMMAIRNEYCEPTQPYTGKEELPALWNERMAKVNSLPDIINFSIHDQDQIIGPRGYIKSDDDGYQIIRLIALPLVSYIYVEKVGTEKSPIYYWKLFVDFEKIWENTSGPLVFKYGKAKIEDYVEDYTEESEGETKKDKTRDEIRKARNGQGKYREGLLEQCRFCPITKIADERLLIASHIKPWAASTDEEKTDPYNGYILSPLYDKLFDRGFITFTEKRRVVLSDFLSSFTWKQIGLKNGTFYDSLPMDEKRIAYLDFHHQSVFKGSYDSE